VSTYTAKKPSAGTKHLRLSNDSLKLGFVSSVSARALMDPFSSLLHDGNEPPLTQSKLSLSAALDYYRNILARSDVVTWYQKRKLRDRHAMEVCATARS
jgi:hypothetical protein